MSLINDALKRAHKSLSEKKGDPPPPLHIQPLESSPARTPWLSSLVPLVLAVVLLSAGWFFWKFWTSRQPLSATMSTTNQMAVRPSPVVLAPTPPVMAAQAPPPPVTNPIQVASLPPTPTPTPTPTPAPVPARALVSGNVAASIRQSANRPVASVPSDPGLFPELRLQGIYFRRSNPSVLINGKHLYRGNSIEGARVVLIERQSVVLEFNGTRQTLLLQ